MKKQLLLMIGCLLFLVGCNGNSQTDQQKIREKVQRTRMISRFTKIDLPSTGKLYVDNLDKKMWIRFLSTDQAIEVRYSLDDIELPAEDIRGK